LRAIQQVFFLANEAPSQRLKRLRKLFFTTFAQQAWWLARIRSPQQRIALDVDAPGGFPGQPRLRTLASRPIGRVVGCEALIY